MFFFGLALIPFHALAIMLMPLASTPTSCGPAQIIHITEQRRLRHKARMLRRKRLGY